MNPLVAPEQTARAPRTALSVNLNKVAHLRNTRHLGIPSVVRAATLCLQAGAQGITVHPRPDERHIRAADVFELKELLQQWPEAEYNIEGNPFQNLMRFIREARPHQATFVPDSEDQFTSDHGWNLHTDANRLLPILQEIRALGSRISLFMDAESDQWQSAKSIGADRVELYTEPYAEAWGRDNFDSVLARYSSAAAAAQSVGLGVNAGHDLNLANLGAFCRIPGILEVSIGHALIADALDLGLANAVRAYLRILV